MFTTRIAIAKTLLISRGGSHLKNLSPAIAGCGLSVRGSWGSANS